MRTTLILMGLVSTVLNAAETTEPGFRSFEVNGVKEIHFASSGGRVVRDFDKVKLDIARRVTGLLAGGAMPTVWIDGKPHRLGDQIECKFSSATALGGAQSLLAGIQPITSLLQGVDQAAAVERSKQEGVRETILTFTIDAIEPQGLLLKSESNEPIVVEVDVQSSPSSKKGSQRIEPDEFVFATGVVVHPMGYILAPIQKPGNEVLHAYTGQGRSRLTVIAWDSHSGIGLLKINGNVSSGCVTPSTLDATAEVTLQGCSAIGAIPVVFKGGMPGSGSFLLPKAVLPGASLLDADGRLLGLAVSDSNGYRSVPVSSLKKLMESVPAQSGAASVSHAWHDYSVLISRRR